MGDTPPKTETGQTPVEGTTPMRDVMISTAVHFLQSPKVQQSPMSQKRAFLIKKGLTNEEIDKAIDIASQNPNYQQQALVPAQGIGNPHLYKPSFLSRVNRYGSAIIVIGIALYGLRQFYKLYIEPLFYGDKRREDKLSLMEEQLLEVNRSLSQLRRAMSSIEENLGVQKEQLNKYLTGKNMELDQCISPSVFLEMKTDLATVKSLLLNRHQFPDVPKFSPSIPSWQMIGGSDKKNEREVEKFACDQDGMREKDGEKLSVDCTEKKRELWQYASHETPEFNGDIENSLMRLMEDVTETKPKVIADIEQQPDKISSDEDKENFS